MSALRLVAADTVAPQVLHAAFGAAFADYLIGPFRLAPDQWPQFLARQGVDLPRSRAAVSDGEVLAFALAAPRGDGASWRLGAMGALPLARGTGVARALLDDFIARAREAGCARVELECFAQNERGVRLYRGRGFEAVAPLYGWRREPGAGAGGIPQGEAAASVQEVALAEAFASIDATSRRRGDLPLQVTPASLREHAMPLRAWRCGAAVLVAGEADAAQVTVCSLVDEEQDQRGAGRLLQHLLLSFPAHAIHVPQLQRDDLGGIALQRLGFARLPLHQLLMHKDF